MTDVSEWSQADLRRYLDFQAAYPSRSPYAKPYAELRVSKADTTAETYVLKTGR